MNTRLQLYQTKKKKKWPWVVALLVLLLTGGGTYYATQTGLINWQPLIASISMSQTAEPEEVQSAEPTPPVVEENPQKEEPEKEPEISDPLPLEEIDRSGAKGYEGNETLPTEPTYIDGILMASKQYPLPADYAPGESTEARTAFNEMAAAALLDNIRLVAFSTYRSFERQQELYTRYVNNDGQEAADRYSARPGHSEHQSGLAFDIGEENAEQHFARESFGETAAGKWVAENAHTYGFILRYPEGKEKITGYMYEPWHFRFIGKEKAQAVYASGLTLEEYLEQ